MFCSRCGREMPEGSAFCGFCGAEAAGGSAESGQGGPVPSGSMQLAALQQAPRGGRRALFWVLGVAALLLAAGLAVVLALVLRGGGGEAAKVEEVARDYARVLEMKDVDLLAEIMEPDFLDRLEEEVGRDWKEVVEENIFDMIPEDLRIEIAETEVSIKGNRATLRVIKGTMTYTDETGEKVTERAEDIEVEDMEMVRVNGRWYLSGEWLEEQGYEPDMLAMMRGGVVGDGSGPDQPEEAMEAYLSENLGPDYWLIELVVSDGEAWGAAIDLLGDTTLNLLAERDADGWEVKRAGRELDYPSWYEGEYLILESAMLDYVAASSAPDLTFRVTDLVIRGAEAAGIAICTNKELEQPLVLMRRGAGGGAA